MPRFLPRLLLSLTCSLASALAASAAGARPNIILIFADDLGYGDVSCYGAKDIKTPHIDSLAAQGTKFTSFYVGQAVCTASRAALMTGSYPNRVSMSGALNHTSPTGIHPREKLLSQHFKDQGYATGMYGKWHLGHQTPFLPTRRGFDEWLGIPYSNDNGPLHPVTRGIPALPLYHNEDVIEIDPDQAQFTKRFTEAAVAFIERNREKPFFLYLPHVMPHVPIFVREQFRGKSARGLYGDVVQELDWGVGQILATLERLNLEQNTLVVFTSDNGPFLSYGEHAGLSGPLREGKLTTFEGGHRTPCLVRWPGKVPAGRVSDEPWSTMDFHVTVTKLIGAKPAANVKLDGADVLPLLTGQPGARGRDEFLFYSGDELHAVRQGDWKLHVPHEYLTTAAEPGKGGKPSNYGKMTPLSHEVSGIRGIASRHGYRYEKLELSLFNLKDDPGETKNLAAQHPDTVARLQKLVAAARADLGDSLTNTKGPNIRPAGNVTPTLPPDVKRVSNIEYARRNTGGLLVDLYLPTKATAPLPVVLWIHGGGWKRGTKEACPLAWLASEGFAVVSLQYRLSWMAKWPAQIDDVRAAVRWLRTNAAKYNLDPRRIAVSGGSSGGNLASILGTASAPADDQPSSRVQAVVDFYGASDMLTMPVNVPGPGKTEQDLATSNGAKLLGVTPRDDPALARQTAPLHHVTKDDPPFLIIHGDKDPQVPLEQSERLHAKLKATSVPSELLVLPGAGHGGPAFNTPEVKAKIRDFLVRAMPLKS